MFDGDAFDFLDAFNKQRQKVTAGVGAVAQVQKAYHDALVNAGFTKDQAYQMVELLMREIIRALPAMTEAMFKIEKDDD
jgi:hypothetical protein